MQPSVNRIAVFSHGDPQTIAGALTRLEAIAVASNVEIVDGDDADLAVVLGGDGTMLRALHRFLDTSVPVIGVNFGRVGFLSAMGRDAMAVTFVSPHSLHARPLVVPRGLELTVTNVTRDGPATVIADGQPVGDLPVGRTTTVWLGDRRALLALLPEMTFFHRYSETFAS